MTALALLVPVEQVQAGDTIRRPSGTTHTIHAIAHYPAVEHDSGYVAADAYVIAYVSHESTTYENKARDKSGFNQRSRGPILKTWKPLQAGEPVPIVRRAD